MGENLQRVRRDRWPRRLYRGSEGLADDAPSGPASVYTMAFRVRERRWTVATLNSSSELDLLLRRGQINACRVLEFITR